MKNTETITSVSINDIIAHTGRTKPENNFHVFKSSELSKAEKPSKPVRIDHFIILLVIEGTAQVRINLIDHVIQKNGLLVITPNTIHEFSRSAGNDFIAVGFVPGFFARVNVNKRQSDAFTFFSSQSDPCFQLTAEEAATLHELMVLLYKKDHTEEEHPFKEEVIQHAFNLFMFELAAIAKKQREGRSFKLTRKEEIMMSFLKILPEHFKEERSVQFYANQLFITPKHLTKTVKELTNKTCGEIIDDMVIMEAKVLLNDMSRSVANVADSLHFSDQFFFSKFFKNHTGLTPTEFRTTT
ncbi:helix-turn-helix domain-containing protein [Ferruginibacter profundus]